MPLKLPKFRRAKRYNVLNKNCFVTRILLLDNSSIEWTLSLESTGQECLEAVAQRLELREMLYFGLWFLSKTHHQRWVDLQKPLKKQLDKFANEPLLFFGVMFYVPNVSLLQQENTRYQYYLQVKKDILDGRLRCPVDFGIRLAGLAVQADFGNYNNFQSLDFLRKYVLFPMDWAQDESVLKELTQKVALEYKAHSGMSQAEAELHYIKEAEQLDGFGQESFPVKDNHGNDLTLCIFFGGIFINDRMQRSAVIYRWSDIGNITHNKSAIVIEVIKKEESVLYHTDDIENAKYISRLFSTRHVFYKENSIFTEPSSSPITRCWPNRSATSLARQQPFILPPMQKSGDHYFDAHTSQDNISHGNEDTFYYRSQSSLDRCALEFNYVNGTVPNGSVCSTHSMNSLNRSQNFIQASPMSSNLSIPGSDIMRPDYIPSHRHSAIIVPSYRPTPDYDTVMRHMKRGAIHMESHSQSLRNLNIGNTHAYKQHGDMVYSQPEMQERQPYTTQYNHQGGYIQIAPQFDQVNHSNATTQKTAANSISHTVSTPELTNMQVHNNQCHSTAPLLRTFVPRPLPQYSRPRPATSTPDLASHCQRYVSGSSPDLVTRKVQLSVKTFQEDSSPVHLSLQEVSEPLMTAKHHPSVNKRHSLEVISSMVRGIEAMTLKTLNAPLPRRNTLRDQLQPVDVMPKPHVIQQLPPCSHKKTFSDATMVIHSSGSEGEEESPELVSQIPASPGQTMEYSAQLKAALARIPNKPPPEYPGPRESIRNGPLMNEQERIRMALLRAEARSPGPSHAIAVTRPEQVATNGPSLGPSLSEPDLTSVKERVKKEPVKERPVSEMFSLEDSFVEREIRLRSKEKMATLETQKRPLMRAALNGLSVARVPVPEDNQDDTAKMLTDEMCKLLRSRLEEGMVFTEYEQIPKKKSDGVFTTATLPENIERNRIREVVPYEENRVELVPTKENNTGYINASHIKVSISGEEWHYIGTQGPLPQTCHDFWQMVWEQGVNVIAMVTAEEEGGRCKSHRYWPKLGSRHSSATYGKFKVTTKFRTDSGCHATTGLKVKHLVSLQERTVWHLQYTDWPDQGCPEDIQGFLSYLDEIQSVRRHTNIMLDSSKTCNPPIVVHCSAGVGRTGVVMLTELMIRSLEHNENVDVPVMLRYLREQRMFLVQTIAQYNFVYHVLIQFLQNSRLI